MISYTDEQLMEQVKGENLEALAPLFEKYHVNLYNFFLRMTRNSHLSEDLTQEVFRRILHYRESYNSEYGFRSWLYQIARNVLNKHFGTKKWQPDEFIQTEQLEEEESSTLDQQEQLQRYETLYEALTRLTGDQREIIELARFQGLKYEEIAEITGNSVPAIKVKMHRAIKRLREVYFQLA